eukprot:Hpha_TRINITY_DN15342_c5_g1::TRINITY_DN15342_c5_g1_i1::g.90951::m.90951
MPVELGFAAGTPIDSLGSGWAKASEGDSVVLRGAASLAAGFTAGGVRVVVLPYEWQDRVWKVDFGGEERVAILDTGYLVTDSTSPDDLLLRSENSTAQLWLQPAPASLRLKGVQVGGEADGVFHRYNISFATRTPPSVTYA